MVNLVLLDIRTDQIFIQKQFGFVMNTEEKKKPFRFIPIDADMIYCRSNGEKGVELCAVYQGRAFLKDLTKKQADDLAFQLMKVARE